MLYIICIIDEEIVQIQFISSAYDNGLSVSNSLDFDILIVGISPVLKEVVVGSILGDGWLEKQKINARFRFEQSHIRKEFFFYLFEYFSPLCKSSPKLRERFDKRTNKTYKTWHFSTLSVPFLTHYHNLFYVNNKKVIPVNIIDLITPLALAIFIMCDGYKHNKGVTLATNAFSISDNELLINALNQKFGFSCRMIFDHNYPSIHIPFSDLSNLQNLVVQHMHTSLLYKIHL